MGDSPLALAARNGHKEVVKILLGRWGVDPDESNGHGQTPLCYAAAYGRAEVVEILPVFATGQSVRPEGRTRTDYES